MSMAGTGGEADTARSMGPRLRIELALFGLVLVGGAAGAACEQFDAPAPLEPPVDAGRDIGPEASAADAGLDGQGSGVLTCDRRRAAFGSVSECMRAAADGGCALDASRPPADAGCGASAVVCECQSSTAGTDLVTDDCACR